jgi:hypothetical protein
MGMVRGWERLTSAFTGRPSAAGEAERLGGRGRDRIGTTG